jgi:hypothetical protein
MQVQVGQPAVFPSAELIDIQNTFQSLNHEFDVAVATHKTIDLVFSTQVFKLKRDMQRHSRPATASTTLRHNGVAEVTHDQPAHSPATSGNRPVTAGAPPAGAQDHSRPLGEDQCQ